MTSDNAFEAAHRNSDRDLNDRSIHHTLGFSSGQAAPGNKLKEALADIEALVAADVALDSRLDAYDALTIGPRLTALEATDVSLDSRLDAYDALNIGTRLTGVESVNTTQNTRLTNLEAADVALDSRIDALELDSEYVALSQGSAVTLTAGTTGNLANLSQLGFVRTRNPTWMTLEYVLDMRQVAAGTNVVTFTVKRSGTAVYLFYFGPQVSGFRGMCVGKFSFLWDGSIASPRDFTLDYDVPAGSNFSLGGASRAFLYETPRTS